MQAEAAILVVDDDPMIREELEMLFRQQSFDVVSAASIPEAQERLAQRRFSLAFVDVRIGGADGIDLTTEIRDRFPDVDVIMITGFGSIKNAVEAIRRGAVDYITKPFVPEDLLLATRNALERRRLIDEVEYLRRELSERYSFANMVSRNPVMLDIFATVAMLAENDVTVLIRGESGTGKELVARAIHYQGKRRAGRFVPINCAALPESLLESELFGYERGAFTGAVQERVGKIELAHGGTLFLDEVEIIPPAMQAKLLRVLEERSIERLGGNKRISVDMRVVVATNQDLTQLVQEGKLREDFYYRINVVPVTLPPLRERREDLPLLVADFLRRNQLATAKGINRLGEHALGQLSGYSWPGNIRELQNVMERAVLRARGDTIGEVDLPAERDRGLGVGLGDGFVQQKSLREFLKAAEKAYLANLLEHYHGGIAGCARHASVDQATLHRKIKAHGLRPSDFRRNGQNGRAAAQAGKI